MGTRGDGMRLRSCRCACGLRLCSLQDSGVGAAGAAAIGAGLVHVPKLRTLKYAMCPAMNVGRVECVHGRSGQSHAFAAVFLCVRFVFAQPREQPHRCLGCGSHRCSFGPLAAAADTEVRCMLGL
jgi:hypothetical protein